MTSSAAHTPETVRSLTTDQLYAIVRLAGWQPASVRQQVLEPIYADVPRNAIDAALAAADVVEANGPVAQAELDRRAAAAPAFTGYVA